MKAPDLFDYAAARAARDEGIARGTENANVDWKLSAEMAVLSVARELELFTADDVVRRIDPRAQTPDMRALGGVMTRAAKAGWCVKTQLPARECERRSRHSAPLNVWQSLIKIADA